MRVLLVGELSWSYVIGSSTKKVQNKIFDELKNHYLNVHFFEICPTDSIFAKLFKKTVINNNKLMKGGLFRLWFRILRGEYDIVHFLVIRNYMILFLPLFFLRAKFIVMLHDTYSMRGYEPKKLNHFIRIIIIKFAHAIIVFTKSDKNLASFYHKKDTDIFILKHGCKSNIAIGKDLKDFQTEIILFSGGLGKHHKGLSFLQQALQSVQLNHRLLVCGLNYSGENHKNYIGALDEREYLEILSQSKIVVVPSKYESFSLVALEAFASGIPVILTKSTGISDYLVDGKGCFIVDYGDVKNLAKKIELLLTDRPMWMRMRNEALTVAQEFDWKNIIDKYIHIYNTL